MRRSIQYAVALLTAGVVTSIVSFFDQSVILLFGIFGIYTAAIEITLRYPELVWSTNQQGGHATGVFAGGTTVGLFSLLEAFDSYGAFALGLGVVLFTGSAVIWMLDDREIVIESLDVRD